MSEVFRYRSRFSCSVDDLYDWHSRQGALERLIPPWEDTTVLMRQGGLDPGGVVKMRMHAGPIPFTWTAHHVENRPGELFRDIQYKGPFSHWSHTHVFSPCGDKACLEDRIEYALPFHSLIPEKIQESVRQTLLRTFTHRQNVLEADLDLHAKCGHPRMRILVSGASGVLGRALQPLLTTGGHEIWRLVRRRADPAKHELYWNPAKGVIDDLPEFDAIVHLAGEYIGVGRWTARKKKAVIESRTKGTLLLAQKAAEQPRPPRVFLCASAVGYYGNTGEEVVDESAGAGNDFISEVCRLWEQAALPAERAGIRTVLMRIGVSLSPRGGALQRLLSTAPFGLVSRFGSGRQYISWISLDDTISAIYHAMCCDSLCGPVNIAAPYPVTNSDFMQILAEISGNRLMLPVPENLLKLVYGQMAPEILLSGCRTSCRKLTDTGFTFRHQKLPEALRALLGKFTPQ